jgi:hypothetical protein
VRVGAAADAGSSRLWIPTSLALRNSVPGRRPLTKPQARSVVDTYTPWCVGGVAVADIVSAFQIEDQARIGFWDALIVAVAARNGASRIGGPERRAVDRRRGGSQPVCRATGQTAPVGRGDRGRGGKVLVGKIFKVPDATAAGALRHGPRG